MNSLRGLTFTFFVLYFYRCRCLPLVETPLGKIQGTHSISYKERAFSQFLGIPYAKPPIGNLRFEEPQPVEKWAGIWHANTSTICMQINHEPEPEGGKFIGNEDCLHLNVFVPQKEPSKLRQLDVIVHIHSGALNFGFGNAYAGPKYLMDENVILVTFNYRLGPLGFLSTEDNVVPGNNGMKDQVLALKWIQENIEYFGGNRDSVTITGLSAGAASVHYHYLSPLSIGLFKRGISVSGNALCPWVFQENAWEKAQIIGNAVGCNYNNSKDLVDCLKQRPGFQIVNSVRLLRSWLYNPFSPFGVVVEKGGNRPFLTDFPYRLLSEGKVHDLPWMTTVTSEEGLYPAADYMLKKNYLPDLENRWEELFPAILDFQYTLPIHIQPEISKKIKEHYLNGKSISRETYQELIQMMSDRHFINDAEKAAKLQAAKNKSPVYFYYFKYSSETVDTYALYYTFSPKKYGVCHGDDMMFIFSSQLKPLSKLSSSDESIQYLLLKIWKNFAKTGVPKIEQTAWTAVSRNQSDPLNYLNISSSNEISMAIIDELGQRSFWDSLPFKENQNLL